MHEIIVQPEKNENAVAELQNIYPPYLKEEKKKKKTFAFYFKYREIVVIFGKQQSCKCIVWFL